MNRRFQQVLTALKERSCVSYAKIATIGGFCNVDLIIVKATAPDDLPLPDKYVHQLLKIFAISAPCCRAFSLRLARRFGKTRSWRVALKCLLLLHRLIRSVPEDSPFRSELLWNRSNGLFSLYPCRFQDVSSSNPETYTMFIRSYAHLLDEALGLFLLEDKVFSNENIELPENSSDKMKGIGRLLEILPQLQSLIDRVMDCRPTDFAARSFLIQTAMKYIIRDSFICYTMFRKDIVLVLDNLFQMPYRCCVAAFGIYKKASLQANQLWGFYDWCRDTGVCGRYEYPFVDRIPLIQIQALENFINGMWQLTESSATTSPPSPSPPQSSSSFTDSRSSLTEDDKDKQLVLVETLDKFDCSCFPEKLDEDEEREPLIQLDDTENDDSWEDLLEASVNLSHLKANNLLLYNKGFNHSHGSEKDEWKIQAYNINGSNPFDQPSIMAICSARYACSDPKYPWGR